MAAMDRTGLTRVHERTTPGEPDLFRPHPNLSDEINRNIIQSEIDGGVHLDALGKGAVLRVETQHHRYTVVNLGQGRALISGHPVYCPDPVPVSIEGSTWGGSMLKMRFIGRGMHLEFLHPQHRRIITSRVREICEDDKLSARTA